MSVSPMTANQLQDLIESIKISSNAAVEATITATSKAQRTKTLKDCILTYWGDREYGYAEEFIDFVETYKVAESISDEDALRGIAVLLHGEAFKWWENVKKDVKTWNEAIHLFRKEFITSKPAFKIYIDISKNFQRKNMNIDNFFRDMRDLLEQLPKGRHDEETEIDLIYGRLPERFRKHISRKDIKTFHELLEICRFIEDNYPNDEESTDNIDDLDSENLG